VILIEHGMVRTLVDASSGLHLLTVQRGNEQTTQGSFSIPAWQKAHAFKFAHRVGQVPMLLGRSHSSGD
jgi:hypothetical protein